ncbi:S8 family serine peptidase, partial [Pelomonas sp. KK5]|uniref:S8 family serine peptidase n=1 Tax=Pelomonas sp. KK5 TaxID=1855730 RepID=UPI00097BBDCF
MGRRISTIALGLAALLAAGANLLPATAAADTTTVASSNEVGRVIVRFKAGADSVRARAMTRAMSRSEVADVAQTRATALGMRRGLSTSGTTRIRAGRSLDERTQVVVVQGISSAALAAKLAADGEVEMAVVDQRRRIAALPNDTLFGSATPNAVVTGGAYPTRVIDQWYLKAPTATVASSDSDVVSSINAPAAWDVTTGSSSVVVAVIDTGVRYDHPDLGSKLLTGYDFIGFAENGDTASVAVANDGNGADADASDPGDWVSQADINAGNLGSGCTSSDISNSSWHGTRVSGLVGALSNNGVGMAGVSWNSPVLPVRVLGKCGGYDSDIIAGMKWAAGVSFTGQPSTNPTPAKVLNLSLGGTGTCGTTGVGGLYRDAISQINAKGAVVVVAAGNSEGLAVGLPGNCPGVIAVTGLRHVGSKVGFSSIGSEVAIAAPGGNCINTGTNQPCLYPIVSTVNTGTQGPSTNDYTGSSASVGTSFSTPLVAGTVALMLSANSSLTPTQVKAILQSTARPFVTSGATAGTVACHAPTSVAQDECYCTTATCGAGMLDAAKAVALAVSAGTGTVTVTATPTTTTAGQTVALSATSGLSSALTVASTTWSVVSGPGTVSGSGTSATLTT